MPNQYLRKVGLVVSTGSKGLDLSNMRIRFKTQNMHEGAPNTAWIRVYNLAENTAQSIQKEFQEVSLQAGYEDGNFALIFKGQVMQVKKGRESNVDSYVDIIAADALLAHTFGFVAKSLDSASQADQVRAVRDALSAQGVTLAPDALQAVGTTGGVLPRGKVMWGLASPLLRNIGDTTATTWSIQNGVLTFIQKSGYKSGEAVEINSQTGMVGIPEQSLQGIEIKTLLNPLIAIGGRVKINNADVNQTTNSANSNRAYWQQPSDRMYASTAADGIYRVLVCEHSGDTRGTEWYSSLTCLSLDGAS
jgi:hypothetical protein